MKPWEAERERQEARRQREWQVATFEEKYGPWICMGCGRPHELGLPCSDGELEAERVANAEAIAAERRKGGNR